MRNMNKFISNGLIMTATSLLLRYAGIIFNTYISASIGAEGMGVYGLVQSVFGFAVTFACSGVNFGTVRVVSEALATDNRQGAIKAVKYAVLYALFFSSAAFSGLFFGAEFIGSHILGDARTVFSIRILGISLPFISVSSVFNGYFSALRTSYKNSVVSIIEQMFQIFITVNFLSYFSIKGLKYSCAAIALGVVSSEILSLAVNYFMYLNKYKKAKKQSAAENRENIFGKLISISLPLALSAYARSGLLTAEHLLIPRGLRHFGESVSSSLATYGLINGMVFPIIMFPSCIVYSFSSLLVPELARYRELGKTEKIDSAVSKVIKYALTFSVGVAGILICFSYELSYVIYKTEKAYEYLWLFAPLVTVMYLDAAVDGILKGLNEQLFSMKINIADALMSVVLVYILVPIYGVRGYVLTVFVCEIFNCCMSLVRLVNICKPQISVFGCVVKPLAAIIFSTFLVTFLFDALCVTKFCSPINLSIRITCVSVIYIIINMFGSKKHPSFCV